MMTLTFFLAVFILKSVTFLCLGKKRYILFAIDNTKRFAIINATEKLNANTTKKFVLKDILIHYGMVLEVQTDRETHFIANTLKQDLGICGTISSAYRPQSKGITEMCKATLMGMLRCYVN